MNRARSREVVMELLYQVEIQKEYEMSFVDKMLDYYEQEVLDIEYVRSTLSLWLENKNEIEASIEKHLKNWTLDRISKLDLCILRLGVTEMIYVENIPKKVSINEAVNLCKKYVDDKSGKFINGVLSHFADEE